jgi:hypothetical protein
MVLKSIKISYIFLAVLIVACSSSYPSDRQVIQAISAHDFYANIGCIQYRDFIRMNGYGDAHRYTIKYQINKVLLTTPEECMEKIAATAKNDPVQGLAIISKMMDYAFELASLEINASNISEGSIDMINTERGWIVP